ncbi:MAG: hypothetical protein AB9922_07315 [Bacteroidales bacterium]
MQIATTKERIVQYLDFKGIKLSKFYAETGLKRGLLDSDKLKQSITDVFVATIIEIYEDINLEWLITGKGEMLKQKRPKNILDSKNEVLKEMIAEKDEKIDKLNREVGKLLQMIEGFRDLQLKRALKDADASDASAG